MTRKTIAFGMGAELLVLAAAGLPAQTCTRILWNTNKLAVVAGRTMDWPESTEPILTVFPRGLTHNGGYVGAHQTETVNPAIWTSRYGSIGVTIYGIGTADSLNERGLAGHMLYLQATDFGPRDPSKPAVHAGLWLQYLVDNAANVDEALALLDKIQIRPAQAHGHQATVHLALEDASGDSAIVEYVAGKPLIHHGRQYRVMTNDPSYDQQLALLKKFDFSHPNDEIPLPGNVNPRDRFQRASYFAAMLPEPKDQRQAIAGILAIARNASVPFGAPYHQFGVYNTEYRTAIDLTDRRYFFELSTAPNLIWADLDKFDLSPGAPVMELNPENIDLSGNVTTDFKKADKAPF